MQHSFTPDATMEVFAGFGPGPSRDIALAVAAVAPRDAAVAAATIAIFFEGELAFVPETDVELDAFIGESFCPVVIFRLFSVRVAARVGE